MRCPRIGSVSARQRRSHEQLPSSGTGTRPPRCSGGRSGSIPRLPGPADTASPQLSCRKALSETSAAELRAKSAREKLFGADESQPHRRQSHCGVIPSPLHLLQSSARGQILRSETSRWETLSRDFHKDDRFLCGLVLFKS